MTLKSDILVTGATGNLGREVVARLDAYDVSVRALVRDPGTARLPDGVTPAAGDLSAPGGLEDAVKGCEAVFLVWPFLSTEHAPAVLDVLARHVRRIVYVSSSGVDERATRQSDPINQLHADMEQLIERSGPEWTFLRADTLASNARAWAGQIRYTGAVRGPDIAATAVVHERDVAEVAALALTEDRDMGAPHMGDRHIGDQNVGARHTGLQHMGERHTDAQHMGTPHMDARHMATPHTESHRMGHRHTGARHILTGPEVLSRADLVRVIGEASGRAARFEPVPVEVARERMLADGRPPALVEALLAVVTDRPASNTVTSTVQDLTGRPARTFRSWAEEHADLFR